MHTAVCEIIADFLELILFFVGMYYVLAGVFSFFKKPDIPEADGRLRQFAVVIPAHNESAVIANIIASLKAQEYPAHLIDIFVAADKCSDNTAEIAASIGAKIIIPPSSSFGKAGVIRYSVEYINSLDKAYDCIAFFDADNILKSDCIMRMNDIFGCGCSVVQCHIAAKNPQDNWLTAAYSIWQRLDCRFGKQGSHNLGLGCKLSGTGFAISTETLGLCPWDCESIAEDLEYTMKLGLMDIKPAFASKAVVYDEKPSGFKTSVMQRLRWAQGVVDVQGKYGTLLLRKRKPLLWLSLYGDFLGQFTYVLFMIISVFSTISIVYDITFPLCKLWVQPFAYAALNIYLGIGALCAFAGLVIDKELNRRNAANLFGFILYMISWIPIGIAGIFRHNKKEWYHTEHTG